MDFLELVKKRYSVRAYKHTLVENEKIQQVLEAARQAPTAANFQPFKLIVIHTKGKEGELRDIYNADWFVQAPLLICACGIRDQAWVRRLDNKSYCDIDVAIVMDHLILAATELGLGTCWIGAFNAERAKEILDIPNGMEPLIFTPIGYPDDKPRIKKRKSLDLLVQYQ